MDNLFLNIINAISESRFWLMPLLLGCVMGMVFSTLAKVIAGIESD